MVQARVLLPIVKLRELGFTHELSEPAGRLSHPEVPRRLVEGLTAARALIHVFVRDVILPHDDLALATPDILVYPHALSPHVLPLRRAT